MFSFEVKSCQRILTFGSMAVVFGLLKEDKEEYWFEYFFVVADSNIAVIFGPDRKSFQAKTIAAATTTTTSKNRKIKLRKRQTTVKIPTPCLSCPARQKKTSPMSRSGKHVAIKCMKNTFDSIDQVNNLREIQAAPVAELPVGKQSRMFWLVF